MIRIYTVPYRKAILLHQTAGALRSVVVANAAVAASRIGAQRAPKEHAGYYFRMTNTVGRRPGGVAVMAGCAVIADTLTKCALLCSEHQLERALPDTIEFAPCLL